MQLNMYGSGSGSNRAHSCLNNPHTLVDSGKETETNEKWSGKTRDDSSSLTCLTFYACLAACLGNFIS